MKLLAKSIPFVLIILLVFSATAFAASTTGNITTEDLLKEFGSETPVDNSSISSNSTLSTGTEPATVEEAADSIKAEPTVPENYDKIAKLLSDKKDQGYKVFVDGKLIDFSKYDNVLPASIEGRTMIPVRALAESLGATVDWDAAKRLITIILGDKVIQLTLDSNAAVLDGGKVTLEVPAQSIGGRTMIPLRFVGEAFGKKVGWHPYNNAKVISISD